ncbi:unnamed protein product [Trypanosoma congolense IL3000]|uniref:Kinesin-like protein n=1 Tax=Trypanosoma congolense (strain IL3000) TaxID=1068625 RepID=F9WHU9_TRYCI|nr:unnamed protein product [Trypanosoma congolense IL3000]
MQPMEVQRPAVDNVHVSCRFRPLSAVEHNHGSCVSLDEPNQVLCKVRSGQRFGHSGMAGRSYVSPCKSASDDVCAAGSSVEGPSDHYSFSFSRVYPPETEQDQIYKEVAFPIVNDVMQGYNGTVLVYGQTGSGKTHTMFGTDGALCKKGESGGNCGLGLGSPPALVNGNEGIVPRAARHIFNAIHSVDEDVEFEIRVMLIEVYMERVRDLLGQPNNNLQVREDSSGFYVADCKMPYVTSAEELMQLIQSGISRRVTAATACNEASSRSHSVLNITVKSVNRAKNVATVGKLFLVDLAGSERVTKAHVDGMQLEEAKMINKSLTTLGHVIMCLADKQAHVPYRDSKLTRILKDSLGGNSRTALVVCCSASRLNDQETLSTLRFGARAQSVCNVAVVNRQVTVEEMKKMLEVAKAEIKRLRQLLQSRDVSISGAEGCAVKGTTEYSCGLTSDLNGSKPQSDCSAVMCGSFAAETGLQVSAAETEALVTSDSTSEYALAAAALPDVDEVLQRVARKRLSLESIRAEVADIRGALGEAGEAIGALRSKSAKLFELVGVLQEEANVWEGEYKNAMREVYFLRRQREYCREILNRIKLVAEVPIGHIASYVEKLGMIRAMLNGNTCSHEVLSGSRSDEYTSPSHTVLSLSSNESTKEEAQLVTRRLMLAAGTDEGSLSASATLRMNAPPALQVGPNDVVSTSRCNGDAGLGGVPTVCEDCSLFPDVDNPSQELNGVRNSSENLRSKLIAAEEWIQKLQGVNSALSMDLKMAEKRLNMRHGRIESLKCGLQQECAANKKLQEAYDDQQSSYRAQLQAARSDILYWKQRYENLLTNNHAVQSRKAYAPLRGSTARRSLTPTLDDVLFSRSPSVRVTPPRSVSPGRGVIVKPIRGGGNKGGWTT